MKPNVPVGNRKYSCSAPKVLQNTTKDPNIVQQHIPKVSLFETDKIRIYLFQNVLIFIWSFNHGIVKDTEC